MKPQHSPTLSACGKWSKAPGPNKESHRNDQEGSTVLSTILRCHTGHTTSLALYLSSTHLNHRTTITNTHNVRLPRQTPPTLLRPLHPYPNRRRPPPPPSPPPPSASTASPSPFHPPSTMPSLAPSAASNAPTASASTPPAG
jgi:hypothetical protein